MDLHEALAGLRVDAQLQDGDIVTDVVVVAKVVSPESGMTSLGLWRSEGTDWVTRLGMVTAANDIIGSGFEERDGDLDGD